jgi:hypothetical protein
MFYSSKLPGLAQQCTKLLQSPNSLGVSPTHFFASQLCRLLLEYRILKEDECRAHEFCTCTIPNFNSKYSKIPENRLKNGDWNKEIRNSIHNQGSFLQATSHISVLQQQATRLSPTIHKIAPFHPPPPPPTQQLT